MTGDQCRMARAALRWSIDDLTEKATVGRATIARFENGTDARKETVAAIRQAFEIAGLQLLADGEASPGGGPGVRLAAS